MMGLLFLRTFHISTTDWNYFVLLGDLLGSQTTPLTSAKGSVSKRLCFTRSVRPRDIFRHLLDDDCQPSLKGSVQCWFGILLLKFTLSSCRNFAKERERTDISLMKRQACGV
tara:strand:- start:1425 stop:1760 length:336 start_codon:yes stop_codon:yes gene_type:complete